MIVNDAFSIISKRRSKIWHHLRSKLMTLVKAEAKAKAKHIYSTGVNYDRQNILMVQATAFKYILIVQATAFIYKHSNV